jgi:hypothetical protein
MMPEIRMTKKQPRTVREIMDKNCLTLPNIVPEEDDDTSIGSY